MKIRLILATLLILLMAASFVSAQGGDTTLSATVLFDAVSLREAPDLNSPALSQAAQGDTLTLNGRSADRGWFRVTLPDGGKAWAASYALQVSGDASSLPVIEAAVPAQLFVPPGCDLFGIGPFQGRAGQSIVLTQGWEAASEELVQQYLDNVLQIVSFDGRLISTYASYAGEIFYNEPTDTWRVFWSFDMGPVGAGTYTTEWTQIFNSPVTDGLDANGDGQPDTYGPESVTHACTITLN